LAPSRQGHSDFCHSDFWESGFGLQTKAGAIQLLSDDLMDCLAIGEDVGGLSCVTLESDGQLSKVIILSQARLGRLGPLVGKSQSFDRKRV